MLGSGSGIFRWFLAITFVEAINASCGIDQLLFSGKERMASGTDFDVQVTFASRAGLECLAASAGDRDFNVFGVDSWFHLLLRHSLIAAPGRIFQTFYDRGRGQERQALDRMDRIQQDFSIHPANQVNPVYFFFVFLSQNTPSL